VSRGREPRGASPQVLQDQSKLGLAKIVLQASRAKIQGRAYGLTLPPGLSIFSFLSVLQRIHVEEQRANTKEGTPDLNILPSTLVVPLCYALRPFVTIKIRHSICPTRTPTMAYQREATPGPMVVGRRDKRGKSPQDANGLGGGLEKRARGRTSSRAARSDNPRGTLTAQTSQPLANGKGPCGGRPEDRSGIKRGDGQQELRVMQINVCGLYPRTVELTRLLHQK